MITYQRYDSDKEEWVDFPEFIKFNQPTWVVSPDKFSAWVIKNTPKGKRLSCELMGANKLTRKQKQAIA